MQTIQFPIGLCTFLAVVLLLLGRTVYYFDLCRVHRVLPSVRREHTQCTISLSDSHRPTRSCYILDACVSVNFLCHRSTVCKHTTTSITMIYDTVCVVFQLGKWIWASKTLLRYYCLSLDGAAFIISMVSPSLHAIHVLAWLPIFYTESLLLTTLPATMSFAPLLPGHKKKSLAQKVRQKRDISDHRSKGWRGRIRVAAAALCDLKIHPTPKMNITFLIRN